MGSANAEDALEEELPVVGAPCDWEVRLDGLVDAWSVEVAIAYKGLDAGGRVWNDQK